MARPKTGQPNDMILWLLRNAGEPIAKAFWQEFGGTQDYIPAYPEPDETHAKLMQELSALSAQPTPSDLRQIAKKLNMTSKALQNRLSKPAPRQIPLFG